MGRLEGKTALVTGGGTGIGRASAERLAAEGAYVFVAGRRLDKLEGTVDAIGADSATAIVCDIAELSDLDRVYEAIGARGEGLDVLFANAAISALATLEDNTEEFFDLIFDVNVRGTLFTVKKALPLLNEGAAVILNASTAADRGTEAFGTYGASKAAVRSFARTWANELASRGIRVNAISPGPTDTPAIIAGFGEDGAEAAREMLAARTAPGRMAQPEETAAVVAFLASEESSFVWGANLYVDGGENQL